MAIMCNLGSKDHCVGGEEDGEAKQQQSGPDHSDCWRENGKHSLVEPLLSILSQPPFLAPALPRILYGTCHLTFSPLDFNFKSFLQVIKLLEYHGKSNWVIIIIWCEI